MLLKSQQPNKLRRILSISWLLAAQNGFDRSFLTLQADYQFIIGSFSMEVQYKLFFKGMRIRLTSTVTEYLFPISFGRKSGLVTTANYFERHKNRMRYAAFRKQGYQIGSGTIESAAKQIGMMRLKVPGAIWNEASARKVAKARAEYLSNRWADLSLAI